jgi:acyl carrier protein
MDTRQRVRAFVVELLSNKGDTSEFADGDSLLLSGRLQSIDAVEIALFLEQEYGIDFAEVGFDETQIDSIDRIVSFIEQAGRQTSRAGL